MHAILAATTFALTVTSSVIFGIAAGYALILGWLRLFRRSVGISERKVAPVTLATSGD